MTLYDLSPLLRHPRGLRRTSGALAAAPRTPAAAPAYNLVKADDDSYELTFVATGLAPEDVDIELHEGVLHVTATARDADDRNYVQKHFQAEGFEHRLRLAEHMEVAGARMAHGLLHISLQRVVPEALKPRQIPVRTAQDAGAAASAGAQEGLQAA